MDERITAIVARFTLTLLLFLVVSSAYLYYLDSHSANQTESEFQVVPESEGYESTDLQSSETFSQSETESSQTEEAPTGGIDPRLVGHWTDPTAGISVFILTSDGTGLWGDRISGANYIKWEVEDDFLFIINPKNEQERAKFSYKVDNSLLTLQAIGMDTKGIPTGTTIIFEKVR